ncbi:MAG: hypothetical protein QM813_21360 [Verrucomicrobiota bacterium]
MKKTLLTLIALAACLTSAVRAEDLDADTQTKITAKIEAIKTWAADATIVKAVKAQNEKAPAEVADMTQDKWKGLGILDPLVRSFTKNEAATVLKAKKTESVGEAFLSSADGTKVAFLTKPSNWSHKGKPKHDVPMTGKTWQGAVEVDESTGLRQIQVSVPVLDGDKAIGSLVVGLDLTKLKAE